MLWHFVLVLTIGICFLPRASAQGPVDPAVYEAFHRRDIRLWATKSGLSVAAVESLLRAVGRDGTGDDDGDVYSIQDIDVKSLSKRGQIFIALTGPATGHALAVYVVRSARLHEKVWEALELDENRSCPPETFATESILGEATGSVSASGQILVKIPIWNGEPDQGGHHGSVLLVATYQWNGKTYELRTERTFSRYRWGGDDYAVDGAGTTLQCD